jgi:hypothetical protein
MEAELKLSEFDCECEASGTQKRDCILQRKTEEHQET